MLWLVLGRRLHFNIEQALALVVVDVVAAGHFLRPVWASCKRALRYSRDDRMKKILKEFLVLLVVVDCLVCLLLSLFFK